MMDILFFYSFPPGFCVKMFLTGKVTLAFSSNVEYSI